MQDAIQREVEQHLLSSRWSAGASGREQQAIGQIVLAGPHGLETPNFNRLSTHTLWRLFDEYDRRYFLGRTRDLIDIVDGTLDFRLSKRMTKTGGTTARQEYVRPTPAGHRASFEITVSSTLLFQAFEQDQETEVVSGVRCRSRLEALQRIFEHEMLHLHEMLLWYHSSCAEARFKGMARRFFGHTESTHQLPTQADLARKKHGIRQGDWVQFHYQQQLLRGFVNRIQRRATVLVEHPGGELYSDGQRYRKFYVPVQCLERVARRA